MWSQVRSWFRFTVFMAGNALVLASVYLLVIEPAIAALRERGSRIEQSAIRLERLRSELLKKQSMPRLDANEIEHATKRFLQGSNESLSTADLLTRLRQVADDHAVSFSSVTTLPPRTWFGRQLVGARVEFATVTPRAAEVMAGIEDATCFLFIRSARLTTPVEAAGDFERLGVIIEVYGVTRWSNG